MPLVSVTRLRVRSGWLMLPFAVHVWASTRQVKRADGFLGGQLAAGQHRTFWTITCWTDVQSMRAFRNTGAHMRVMPKLLNWCDEASVLHWEQPKADLPSIHEAQERMVAEGRLSKVRYPSAAHAAGQIPAAPVPRGGPRLRPAARRG